VTADFSGLPRCLVWEPPDGEKVTRVCWADPPHKEPWVASQKFHQQATHPSGLCDFHVRQIIGKDVPVALTEV
jgi:hypothetical protein